jgi:hypothetical protein
MLLNHFLFRSQFDLISLLIKVLIKVNVSQLDPGPSSVVLTSEFSRLSLRKKDYLVINMLPASEKGT